MPRHSQAAARPQRRRAPTPSRPKREIDILTPEEVRELLALVPRRSPTSIRGRALLALLYGSGLRISEALALRRKDLDLDHLTVTVHSGKGAKRRVSALLPEAAEYLQRWIDKRAAAGISPRAPLFCTITEGAAGPYATRPGNRLLAVQVRSWLKRLGTKAAGVGLHKRLHPHGFRHAHAAQLRRAGWDVEQIRAQLGHASLAVTGIYLAHLGANELPDRMRGERWGIGEHAAPDSPKLRALIEALGEEKARKLAPLLLEKPS